MDHITAGRGLCACSEVTYSNPSNPSRYQTLLGCGGISLTNTTELYARFTTTVICNAIIQNSISDCSLTADQSRPVCAETCVSVARPLEIPKKLTPVAGSICRE